MLRLDLKEVVRARCSSNLSQLAEECNKELAKIPKCISERLVSGYRRRLVEVMDAKGCATKEKGSHTYAQVKFSVFLR